MPETLVVNLYGGPGSGKSTTATGVFSLLKLEGFNGEYAPEYAKDLAWEGKLGKHEKWDKTWAQQLNIYNEQKRRIDRVLGKVDFVITDSPILLPAYYLNKAGCPEPYLEMFTEASLLANATYDSLNIWIERVKAYNPAGRVQTEEEAKGIDEDLWSFLLEHDVPLTRLETGDSHGIHRIANMLQGELLHRQAMQSMKEESVIAREDRSN